MKTKLKQCDECGKMTVIWKRDKGLAYCKYCWSSHKNESIKKPTTRSKIRPVSSKRQKQDVEYSKLRERFLTEKPLCEIKFPGCTHYSTDVHHTFNGANRAVYYLIQSTWLSVCRSCHDRVHSEPAIARELGYLK
jgi:hypothetical protein